MKKWSFLVAALLMMSAAVTTTSCVDTDEPEGITNLRTAKAGYLNALAEVKRAEVAVKNAEAARINAAAEVKKADAAYRLAETEYKKAEAAKQEELAKQEAANTEAEKAKAAKKIAEYEQQAESIKHVMDENRIKAEENNITAQKNLAIAQAEMNEVLKAIKLSELIDGVSFDKATMNTVALVLTKATSNVSDAQTALNKAIAELKTAQTNYLTQVYNIEDNGLEAIQKLIDGNKAKIASLEADIEGKTAAVAEYKKALENASLETIENPTVYDKQYQQIQDTLDVYKDKLEAEDVKMANIIATPAFRDIINAAYAIDKKVDLADLKKLFPSHLDKGAIPAAPTGDPKSEVEVLEKELKDVNLTIVDKQYAIDFAEYLTGTFAKIQDFDYNNFSWNSTKGKISDVQALKVDPASWNGWKASGLYYEIQKVLDKNFSSEAKAVYKEYKNTTVTDAEKAYKEAKATWESLLKTYQSYDANAVKAAKEKVYKAGSPATGVFAEQDKAMTDAATLCAGKKTQIDANTSLTAAQKTEQKAAADLEYANAVVAANKAKAAAILAYYKTVAEKGSFAYTKTGTPAAVKKIKLVNGEAYLDGITVKYRDRELTLEQWLSPDYADQFFKSVLGPICSMTQTDLLDANTYVDMDSKADVLAALKTASDKAFGTAFLEADQLSSIENAYMRVEPTVEEAKKAEDWITKGGLYGSMISKTDNATKEFLANYEQAEKDLIAAQETIVKFVSEINTYENAQKEFAKTYDKNYDDPTNTNKDHSGKIADAKKKAADKIDEAEALLKPMADEIARLGVLKSDLEYVQNELKKAIATYLKGDAGSWDPTKLTPAARLEALKDELKKKICETQNLIDGSECGDAGKHTAHTGATYTGTTCLQGQLASEQETLAKNEKTLARSEENGWADSTHDYIIADLEAKLQYAQNEYEIKLAAYEKAVEELKAVLDANSK